MARDYKTPGVYIEEIPKFPPSIAQVETAIPAFVGHTAKAVKDGKQLVETDANGDITKITPVRIQSLLEYVTYFGEAQKQRNLRVTFDETRDADGNTLSLATNADFKGPRANHVMYHAMQAYFANGGGPCYIFSVGGYDDAAAPAQFASPIDQDRLIRALDFVAKEDEVTLLVFPEAQGIAELPAPTPVPPGFNPLANVAALYDAALAQCEELKDRFVVMDVYDGEGQDINAAINSFRDGGVGTGSLKYGAAYYPNVSTIFNYQYDDTNVTIVHNINGTPDANTNSMDDLKGKTFYYSRAEAAIDNMELILPSSSLMVGIYAAVDNDRGVWKAPANVSLRSVVRPMMKVSDKDQERLNVDVNAGKSINVIRSFACKGTLIWGARTLAGNDNEWRYVPVRRFFNMVEESTKKATEQFVFEPNDANTWTRVRSMIENFLNTQWRNGALQGATPEQAFYVSVGLGETMTALDILEGRMIVEIGMAVVRPAEFIILRFSHKMPEA